VHGERHGDEVGYGCAVHRGEMCVACGAEPVSTPLLVKPMTATEHLG